jgi:hypothetical protein
MHGGKPSGFRQNAGEVASPLRSATADMQHYEYGGVEMAR